MISAALRRAIRQATGAGDPLLRPGPKPGRYTTALPFRLRPDDPARAAARLAATLTSEPWIAAAEVTGPGFVTVTVTQATLAGLAVRIAQAGPACATSDALASRTDPETTELPPAARRPQPPPAVGDWPQARAALAEPVTVRLATAAGAHFHNERSSVPAPPAHGAVADAVKFAGLDAVRFALARMPPGGAPPDPAVIARHVLTNPAYAVRYAHAAAAAVLRWAATLGSQPAEPGDFQPRLLARPEELALLDALSWLPERVAMAARHSRPDEFAAYLAGLAGQAIDTMSTTSFTTMRSISSERLWLAAAARTGLAAGLGLLEVGAPGRL